METALQVGQYLASTKHEGLLLTISRKENQEAQIDIFADASYGGENSRSQSGSLPSTDEPAISSIDSTTYEN